MCLPAPPGSCIVIGSFKLGIWHPRDPVFMFVMLMQNTVPTANNMQASANSGRGREWTWGGCAGLPRGCGHSELMHFPAALVPGAICLS